VLFHIFLEKSCNAFAKSNSDSAMSTLGAHLNPRAYNPASAEDAGGGNV
jgi:hypothetical protein